MSYEALFEPITIGDMELKNRIAVAPMNVGYAAPDGYPSDHYLAHYATRARGGFGMIITTAAMVNPHDWVGCQGMNPLNFTDQRYYRFWSEIIKAVQPYNCKLALQLSPGWGRQGHPPAGRPDIPSGAPSAVPMTMDLRDMFGKSRGYIMQIKKQMPAEVADSLDFEGLVKMSDEEYFSDDFQNFLKETLSVLNPTIYGFIWGDTPRELTIPEIEDLEDRMAAQAAAAFELKFDAVEIHSPHGYLIHQFLSPRANKRLDKYGGSLENRARFLTNIVKKIREKVGSEKPVWCRLSGDELQPGGIHHDDMCQVAAMAKDAGLNAINISQGSYEAIGSAFAPDGEGDFSRWAKGFKDATGLPTMAPNFLTPEGAEKAIKEDSVDIIELGRQSLADPFWPAKVHAGREKDIIKCTRCQNCYNEFANKRFMDCSVNPLTGREKYFPELWLNDTKFGNRLNKALKKMEGLPQI